jgi:hypothetical protein
MGRRLSVADGAMDLCVVRFFIFSSLRFTFRPAARPPNCYLRSSSTLRNAE